MSSLAKSVDRLNVQADSQYRALEEMRKLLADLLTEVVQ